jgi:hypothetical protein
MMGKACAHCQRIGAWRIVKTLRVHDPSGSRYPDGAGAPHTTSGSATSRTATEQTIEIPLVLVLVLVLTNGLSLPPVSQS